MLSSLFAILQLTNFILARPTPQDILFAPGAPPEAAGPCEIPGVLYPNRPPDSDRFRICVKERFIYSGEPTYLGYPNKTATPNQPPTSKVADWPISCDTDKICRAVADAVAPGVTYQVGNDFVEVDQKPDQWVYSLNRTCVVGAWVPSSHKTHLSKTKGPLQPPIWEAAYDICKWDIARTENAAQLNPENMRVGSNLQVFPSDPVFENGARSSAQRAFPLVTYQTGQAVIDWEPSYELLA